MKNIIIFFILFNTILFGEVMTTNNAISLYASSNINYIRGDIFDNMAITQMNFYIIKNHKNIINLTKYHTNTKTILGTTTVVSTYNWNGNELKIEIIPSIYDKNRLFFMVDTSKILSADSNLLDFMVEIIPKKNNHYVIPHSDRGSFQYDTFRIRSENYPQTLYLSHRVDGDYSPIIKKTKKYVNQNLYFKIPQIFREKDIIFDIKFYRDFDYNEITKKELTETTNWHDKQEIEYISPILTQNIINLELMLSRSIVPSKINYNKSELELNTKMKMLYSVSLIDPKFNLSSFLGDMNIRKRENEAVLYYALLYEYLNRTQKNLEKMPYKRIAPMETLTLLEYAKLHKGIIYRISDNISDYYWYFKMIDAIKDRKEFEKDRTFILEKENLLKEYVKKYYVRKNGIKTRKSSKDIDIKNIRYMDFMPKYYQRRILMHDYKKYYNSKIGLLKYDKDIDLEYNITFIIKLFQNGYIELAQNLFKNYCNLVEKNGNFMAPTSKDSMGIYGNMLYLYFVAYDLNNKLGKTYDKQFGKY